MSLRSALLYGCVLVSSTASYAGTQVQTFDTSWTVSPWDYYGEVAALAWNYTPYKVWDPALGTLNRVNVDTVVSGTRSKPTELLTFAYSFFTSESGPLDSGKTFTAGSSAVSWQESRTYTGAALSNWLIVPRDGTQGMYYVETTASTSTYSILAKTTLTYEYTPVVPGAFTINVVSGVQTQGQAGRSSFSGTQTFTKSGAGTLVLDQANTTTGSTAVQSGVLRLAHASALPGSTVSVLSGGTLALSTGLSTAIGGLKLSPGGVVDVANGLLTVGNGLSSYSLFSRLSLGRGDGSWSGTSGITSSAAAASNGSRTVGWLDNGDGSVTFGYAAAGDANLDWTIDILDISRMFSSGKFNSGLTATWAEGDFNYDGFADSLDISDFMSSGLFNAGSYNAPVGLIAAVPEPSMPLLVCFGVGVAAFVCTRRTRAAKKPAVGVDRRAA